MFRNSRRYWSMWATSVARSVVDHRDSGLVRSRTARRCSDQASCSRCCPIVIARIIMVYEPKIVDQRSIAMVLRKNLTRSESRLTNRQSPARHNPHPLRKMFPSYGIVDKRGTIVHQEHNFYTGAPYRLVLVDVGSLVQRYAFIRWGRASNESGRLR
jgi:hypothetical protein